MAAPRPLVVNALQAQEQYVEVNFNAVAYHYEELRVVDVGQDGAPPQLYLTIQVGGDEGNHLLISTTPIDSNQSFVIQCQLFSRRDYGHGGSQKVVCYLLNDDTFTITSSALQMYLLIYSTIDRELLEQEPVWRALQRYPMLPHLSCFVAALGGGPRLPVDKRSLEFYATWAIHFMGGAYAVFPVQSELALMISCLCTSEEGQNFYENWLLRNKEEVRTRVSFFMVGKPRGGAQIPTDVANIIGIMYFLAICKNATEANWPRFVEKRMAGLKTVMGVTEDLPIAIPHERVNKITEQVRQVPGMCRFLWSLINSEESPLNVHIRGYLMALSEYRGMTQYKLVSDLLSEPVSLAHLKYLPRDEVMRFKAQQQEYIMAGIDDKYLFFTNPEHILPSRNFQTCAKVAAAIKAVGQNNPLMNYRGGRNEYNDLQELYNRKVTERQDMSAIAAALGISPDHVEEINNILNENRMAPLVRADVERMGNLAGEAIVRIPRQNQEAPQAPQPPQE